MLQFCCRLLTSVLLIPALLSPTVARAIDESDLLPIDKAFALTAQATSRGQIEFTWKIADGYYLYRHRTSAKIDTAGFKADPLQLPAGEKYTDEFFGEVETYRGQLVATLNGAADNGVNEVSVKVTYQGCADLGVCYPPHTQTLNVALPPGIGLAGGMATLPIGTAGKPLFGNAAPIVIQADSLPLPEEQAFQFEAIASSPSMLLMRFTPAPGYYLYQDRSSFKVINNDSVTALAPQWPPAQSHVDEHFGEVAVYFEQVEVPLPLTRTKTEAQTLTLEATFQGCQTDGICYPPMTRLIEVSLPEGAANANTASTADTQNESPTDVSISLGFVLITLLSAVLGGIILNLMPCVLPVLSLKALSLVEGGRDNAHRSALWYTFGVLASFAAVGAVALGLRSAGLALGWGFQLQQPLVIAALAYLMFAVGLSLSGVFQIGAGLAGAGQTLTEKKGPAGDFFTGVLAVVVASPCTAPFMGPALTFAFAAPTWMAMGVFLALGLGLALPFLLIGFVPALANRLPKSGPWMNTFKHAMAFPMYLTAAWLVSILAAQRGADGVLWVLGGAVFLALALWWREKLRYDDRRWPKLLAMAVLLAALWPLCVIHRLPASVNAAVTHAGELAYSADELAKLRSDGTVVFVNMTADWCVSCKVNEKAVLSQDGFKTAMQQANAVYMKGDWTNVDPAITAFLKSHGAVGVPLYVVYAANGDTVEVLPTLLTASIVKDALKRASGN